MIRMWRTAVTIAAMGTIAAGLSLVGAAAASAQQGDGVFHRWDSALSLGIEGGPSITWDRTSAARAGAVSSMRLLIADSAGVVVSGAWAPGGGHYVLTGVDVRPLFPALFFLGSKSRRAFPSLLVQSFSVEVGSAFLLDGDRTAMFAYGFSAAIPLYWPPSVNQRARLTRVALRGGVRQFWSPRVPVRDSVEPHQGQWTAYAVLEVVLGVPAQIGHWNPKRL